MLLVCLLGYELYLVVWLGTCHLAPHHYFHHADDGSRTHFTVSLYSKQYSQILRYGNLRRSMGIRTYIVK
jgi:hypothetical protein